MSWLIVAALLLTGGIGGLVASHAHGIQPEVVSSPAHADRSHVTACSADVDQTDGERADPQPCEPEGCCPGAMARGPTVPGPPPLHAHEPRPGGVTKVSLSAPEDRPPRQS